MTDGMPTGGQPETGSSDSWRDRGLGRGTGARALVAAVIVAVWVALGFLLHLNANVYLLLTIPFTVLFQMLIARQPLRAVWLRGAAPFTADTRTVLLFVLLAVVPGYSAIVAGRQTDWPDLAYAVAAVGGAAGAAYTLRVVQGRTLRQLGACVATVCAIGVVFTLVAGWVAGTLHPASAGHSVLAAGYWFFLYLPALFVVEEVFFRGALDTYLHALDTGRGWASAAHVSALWGLWHLPITVIAGPRSLLVIVIGLLVAQIALGIPLSIGWRRSGNLLVPGAAHALNDTIRNVLIGVP
jgi:membrane protease YdiL (CAAX protease family)